MNIYLITTLFVYTEGSKVGGHFILCPPAQKVGGHVLPVPPWVAPLPVAPPRHRFFDGQIGLRT